MDKEICITKGKVLSSDGQTMPHWDGTRNTQNKREQERIRGVEDCDCGQSISVGSAGHLREVACFISLFCNDTL